MITKCRDLNGISIIYVYIGCGKVRRRFETAEERKSKENTLRL